MMMMTIDVTAQFAPVLWGIIAALGASACAVIAVADRAYAHERAIYVTLAAPSRAGIEQVDPVAVAPVTAL